MVQANYYTTFLFGVIIGICCTALTLFLIGNFKSKFVFKTENLDKNKIIKNTAQFLTILSSFKTEKLILI